MSTATITTSTKTTTSTATKIASNPASSPSVNSLPGVSSLDALQRHRCLDRSMSQHYTFDGFKVLRRELLTDQEAFSTVLDLIANTFVGPDSQRFVTACRLGEKRTEFYTDSGLIGVIATNTEYLVCRTYELFQMVVVDYFDSDCRIGRGTLTDFLLKRFTPVRHSLCQDRTPSGKFLKQIMLQREGPLSLNASHGIKQEITRAWSSSRLTSASASAPMTTLTLLCRTSPKATLPSSRTPSRPPLISAPTSATAPASSPTSATVSSPPTACSAAAS